MLNNKMMQLLGIKNLIKKQLNRMESLDQCVNESYIYDNEVVVVYKSDLVLKAGTMYVDYYNFTYEVYKNGKLFFFYKSPNCDEDLLFLEYDKCDNELMNAIESILKPCKPSAHKVYKLKNMTVENGCTEGEALNALIMLNKLLLRNYV